MPHGPFILFVPNSTIQAYDATLQGIANLTATSGKLLKSNGTDTFTTVSISSHGENALNSNEEIVSLNATQTLTGKTLTSPIISTITNGSATLTNFI